MTDSTLAAPRAGAGAPAAVAVGDPVALKPQRSLWGDAWRQFRRHRLAVAGMVILAVIAVSVLLGPMVYGRAINEIDFTAKMKSPSALHPMGTDDLGQDVLARVLNGGRVSIAVGLMAMIIAITLGTFVGAIAGFFGGWLDTVLMRITDLFISLPPLPLLLLIVFLFRDPLRKTFGPELGVFILIVGVIGGLRWMQPARLVRAGFLAIKEKEYVEAGRCLGVPTRFLIFRHILPNALSSVIVAASLGVGAAILQESTLSFLGLGFPPDVPTWGRLLFDARDFLDLAPHWAIFPGTMIFLTVLSINYIGDGLRDALDPRRTM